MDDDDVREALRRAVMKNEKEHRDVIGPAVEIVRRRRRRIRNFGAAGSGLMVAAGATAAIWVSGSSTAAHPEPAASTTATPGPGPGPHSEQDAWDKSHDIHDRLPGLLNPLLPTGLSIAPQTPTAMMPGTGFRLIGPAGENTFTLTADQKDQRNRAMEMGCVAGGVCSHRSVPGGTLYIQTKNFTADYGGASGYAPGTGKQVLSITAEYEFVPTADDGDVVDLALAAEVSHEHYAAKAPKDWGDQPWPPQPREGSNFNASGALLSPDDFAALVVKPEFRAVSAVLDPTTPVDRATLDRHKAADAAIAAAVKPVLPAGLTLTISDEQGTWQHSPLTLSGPSGSNNFSWQTTSRPKTWRHGDACGGHTRANCVWKDVPGGEIEVTHTSGTYGAMQDSPAFTSGKDSGPVSGGDVYTFYPDDPNGTVIELSTGEQFREIPWAATRPTSGPYADPSQPWPPSSRIGEPFNPGGALLSADQFAAMVQEPGIADVVEAVNKALDPLDGAALQVYN
ncbi:MAG: hypothetical protein HOV83_11335 [Catenulispora sp.]|nr:hypothetical protein [Catenulispora sp.]